MVRTLEELCHGLSDLMSHDPDWEDRRVILHGTGVLKKFYMVQRQPDEDIEQICIVLSTEVLTKEQLLELRDKYK
jgi:hypothetical protein